MGEHGRDSTEASRLRSVGPNSLDNWIIVGVWRWDVWRLCAIGWANWLLQRVRCLERPSLLPDASRFPDDSVVVLRECWISVHSNDGMEWLRAIATLELAGLVKVHARDP